MESATYRLPSGAGAIARGAMNWPGSLPLEPKEKSGMRSMRDSA